MNDERINNQGIEPRLDNFNPFFDILRHLTSNQAESTSWMPDQTETEAQWILFKKIGPGKILGHRQEEASEPQAVKGL